MRIGVLALQGAFREHLDTLHAIGVDGVRVREPADLADVSGLILPGGESTTMRQLIERWGLHEPILDLADEGKPIFGTCAGMIVLATEIAGGEAPILPLLDVTVERNAFGRQLDSFESELDVPVLGNTPVHAVFIRAPIIERTGPDVEILSRLDDGRIVAVRQRNILATAFHPELAGETRFHRLDGDDGRRARRPGRGIRPTPVPDPSVAVCPSPPAGPMSALRSPRSPGKVRAARLTDLAALGELSRLCQSDAENTRSLGLPVNGPPIGVFSLFRLPLGAFRPNDLMFVYEEEGRIAGLVRVEREAVRDEWTIVELDAVGMANAGEIRFRLVQQLLREGAKRAAARFHVACADADGNVELLMQAGFMRYGEERVLFRQSGDALPEPWSDDRALGCGIRPTTRARCAPARPAVRQRDARPGRPSRGDPARRLGAPGGALARPALEPDPDPALRRRRGVRPGLARRRQGRDAARRVPPGRRRQGGSAALPEGPRPSRGERDRPRGLRSWRHRRADDARRRPSSRPRCHRPGPDLRIPDRPTAGGGRLRFDRQRQPADEGNPRPCRRTGPRAGRRPLSGGSRGIR